MENIKLYLQEFGLSENETKIYLALLRLGPSTVLDLSKSTKLNRTTTHVNIESLIQKGMATQLKRGARRQIIAEPPEKLSLIFEQEKLRISKKEEVLPDLIKSINDSVLDIKENTQSEVKYYEGKDQLEIIYTNILKSPEVRAYVNADEIYELFPENFNKFKIAAEKSGTKIWDLQVDTLKARNSSYLSKNYSFKFFPKDITINSMDYLIYLDSIAIIQGGKNPSAIIIKNRFLYENARILFDLMWRLLP